MFNYMKSVNRYLNTMLLKIYILIVYFYLSQNKLIGISCPSMFSKFEEAIRKKKKKKKLPARCIPKRNALILIVKTTCINVGRRVGGGPREEERAAATKIPCLLAQKH